MKKTENIDVYLETGEKFTLAGAVEWPGWQRKGRDDDSALQSLFDYWPRYQKVVSEAQIQFPAPSKNLAFNVVEKLDGSSATDFGVPNVIPSADWLPLDEQELDRITALLKACWKGFDAAVQDAEEMTLRKGPRGGGRDLPGVILHVFESELSYLKQLGWKVEIPKDGEMALKRDKLRVAVVEGLRASMRGEIPARGPRGGLRWPARYFLRRSAWHILDHAWEIEDRAD